MIAAICCWEVSLLTLLVVPLVLVTGATYSKKMNAISAKTIIVVQDIHLEFKKNAVQGLELLQLLSMGNARINMT